MSAASQSGKSLHEQDLVLWATHTAELLRGGGELSENEREEVAEEIFGMASSARRELKSRFVNLLMHLLKIKYQPEKRTRSWDMTVANQRGELELVLEESPSLQNVLENELPQLYARARKNAQIETGLDIFPEQNPFTLEQILNR